MVYSFTIHTHRFFFINLGENVSTDITMLFDEANLDQYEFDFLFLTNMNSAFSVMAIRTKGFGRYDHSCLRLSDIR